MLRIYVIRHGHKSSSEAGYSGRGETPLSERGFEQVAYLADFMARDELDALYSSSQLRALQTAEPVHQRTGADWHVWPVFCETTSRSWADRLEQNPELAAQTVAWRTEEAVPVMTQAEVPANLLSSLPDRFPGVQLTQPFPCPDAWWQIKYAATKETGFARVWLGVTALVALHQEGDHIAVVCHGNSGDIILRILMDMSPHNKYFEFMTAGVTCLQQRETGDFRVIYANRVDFLPDRLHL